jgi:hypothetical protein
MPFPSRPGLRHSALLALQELPFLTAGEDPLEGVDEVVVGVGQVEVSPLLRPQER